jgi:hypothetical protein
LYIRASTGQLSLIAAGIDEPTNNFSRPGRVEPRSNEPRRQSDGYVVGPLNELAHPVSGLVADILSIPRVTTELETICLGQSRVQSQ